MGQLRNVSRDRVVAGHVSRAETQRERLVGFLGREQIELNQGLWFASCRCVHTFGMRTAIDLVFVDGQERIVRLVPAAPPWRIYGELRARAVIELPAGTARQAQLSLGDHLALES